MYKTRTSAIKTGLGEDLLYYASSGLTYDSKILLDPELQEYLDGRIVYRLADGSTNRATEVAVPSFAGVEVFDSSENRRPWFNNCVHTNNTIVNYPYAYMAERYNRATTKYYAPYYRDGLSTMFYFDSKVGSSSFQDYSDVSRRAWWSMLPRFEGEVSMLNFLFELKDFRDIAKAVFKSRSPSKLAKTMRTFRSKMRKIDKKLCQASTPVEVATNVATAGYGAAKIAAQARLINEFAIKPLISDMGNILAQAGEIVNEIQAEFKKQGEEGSTSHYSEVFNIQDNLVPGTYNSYWKASGYYEELIFTATHNYFYNYTMRSESEAFKRYWGLQCTPEVIWNAIPFSFLVDYFAKVGQSIHMMTKDPNTEVLSAQYCESILRTASNGYHVTGDPRANLTVNGKYPVGRGTPISAYTSTHYQRRVCEPNKGSALPKLKLPNGEQGKNMAALALCFIK